MTGPERCGKETSLSRQGPGLRAFARLSPGNKLALAVLNRRLAALPAGVPRALFLGLTRRCQLRCAHCRYRQAPYGGPLPPDIPFSLARKALRLAALAGIPRVIFFGGEPTLYARLPELVREADGLGLFTELDTNGLLLRDKALLAALRSAGLAAVRVSLHASGPAAHDALSGAETFRKGGQALEAAGRAGLLAYISSCVFSGAGRGTLAALLRFAKQAGAHGVRLVPYAGAPGDVFGGRELLSGLKAASPDKYAKTCFSRGAAACAAAAGEILYIDQLGAVRSCPYSLKDLGNLKASGLAPILRRRRPDRALFPCRQAG